MPCHCLGTPTHRPKTQLCVKAAVKVRVACISTAEPTTEVVDHDRVSFGCFGSGSPNVPFQLLARPRREPAEPLHNLLRKASLLAEAGSNVSSLHWVVVNDRHLMAWTVGRPKGC